MMFSNKLVSCIKSNGKVLREFKDTVYIPFGTEYQIYLKNLNSVRAEVDITIDGKSVCDNRLVINANSELEIERFIKDNLKKGNRFKFIERTEQIEKHRGIKTEDGLIRIAFKFEKVLPKPVYVWPTYTYPPYIYHAPYYTKPGTYPWSEPYWQINAVGSDKCNVQFSNTSDSIAVEHSNLNNVSGAMRGIAQNAVFTASASNIPAPGNDVGITVPGSESTQQFHTVSSFATEDEEHVIILRLLGETEGGKEVRTPITVKSKPKCTTCGKVNRAVNKCCSECGTSLQII